MLVTLIYPIKFVPLRHDKTLDGYNFLLMNDKMII